MADKRLDEIAEDATAFWLARSSISFLECAIHLLLTHMTKEQVIEVLKTETEMLEDMD